MCARTHPCVCMHIACAEHIMCYEGSGGLMGENKNAYNAVWNIASVIFPHAFSLQ